VAGLVYIQELAVVAPLVVSRQIVGLVNPKAAAKAVVPVVETIVVLEIRAPLRRTFEVLDRDLEYCKLRTGCICHSLLRDR